MLGAVTAVVVFDSSGWLSDDAAVVVDNSAQFAAGLTATILCLWTSRRARGVQRTWRRLMGLGMAGWTVGQAFWSWYQIFSDTPLPSPSWADVGYLTLPVFALPALLSLLGGPRPRGPREAVDAPAPAPLAAGGRTSLVFLLDGLIVVGSLFILTWSTALGAVVDAGAPNDLAFAVAIAYPITDLILVVIVVLLTVTRRIAQPLRQQLLLLGSGLVGLSVSDSIFAYLVSSGADEMPPATNAGFIAGPLLIALAAAALPPHATTKTTAAATAGRPRTASEGRSRRVIDRVHLLLPYILVGVTGAVVGAQLTYGRHIDSVEATVAWIVLVLVLGRQIITLIENTALLESVSATQAELAHRAQHDPLTGLANRALLSERLSHAMEDHRVFGRPFALLLVDLDDFKTVNDSLGHAVGDRLLLAVGERLRACVRAADTVARFGGDEFAVVLDGVADTPTVVSQRILATLRQPFEIDGQLLVLSASVGMVEPSGDDVDLSADALLRRADGAMYEGKRLGKGRVVSYHPDSMRELPETQAEPQPDPVADHTPGGITP